MEILRFTLSGSNAFFKKPEVNSYCYFTYGNIHKVALLGMFGAILGYGGYTQQQGYQKKKKSVKLEENYPEFYERLKELKISILPIEKNGLIPKKIQIFNNSVGYASKEQGGNLIVKEQWLEHPKWEICLLLDCEEAEKIKRALMAKKCVYYPYLGKNDHPADISDVSIEEAKGIEFDMGRLACLAPKDHVEIADLDSEDKEDLDACGTFQYKENLPYGMNAWTNHYILRTLLYTDEFVEVRGLPVYELRDKKNIVFY